MTCRGRTVGLCSVRLLCWLTISAGVLTEPARTTDCQADSTAALSLNG